MANTIQLKCSTTAGAVPTTGNLADGELAVNANDGKVFVKRSAGSGLVVEVGTLIPRGITILYPTGADFVVAFFTPQAIPLSKIRSAVQGTSPSVTFSVKYGSSLASLTEVVTGGITCTNTTTGLETTSFNNGTIAAGSFVVLTTSAISGTVNSLHVTLLPG
ncbi:MAG TPA: hypothetical protein VNL74_03970 [Methylococcus sp.]|nr:hypothetical protein [Methylococcus sp.]